MKIIHAPSGLTVLAAVIVLLGACRAQPPQALGTLEWDRITLPAPAAERIVRVDVREGDQVAVGAPLLLLEPERTQLQLAASEAQALRSREALDELIAGPRREEIARAQAALTAARAQSTDAVAYYQRLRPLGQKRLVAAAEVDSARAAADSAQAQVRSAEQALLELERGTRGEQIAQGESALAAATAQRDVEAVTLGKLTIAAPRAGRVDSLPYKLGDQAPIGSPLAILLVGEAPYARIYVPEPMRANVRIGQPARAFVDGRAQPLPGRVRMIRSEPVFTPYYALSGRDAQRLSYLAEVQLDANAADLPAGIPVRVEFDDAQRN
jgi:HlyD family secretion protein